MGFEERGTREKRWVGRERDKMVVGDEKKIARDAM